MFYIIFGMALSVIFTSFMVFMSIREGGWSGRKFYIERAWVGVYTFAVLMIMLVIIGIW